MFMENLTRTFLTHLKALSRDVYIKIPEKVRIVTVFLYWCTIIRSVWLIYMLLVVKAMLLRIFLYLD